MGKVVVVLEEDEFERIEKRLNRIVKDGVRRGNSRKILDNAAMAYNTLKDLGMEMPVNESYFFKILSGKHHFYEGVDFMRTSENKIDDMVDDDG